MRKETLINLMGKRYLVVQVNDNDEIKPLALFETKEKAQHYLKENFEATLLYHYGTDVAIEFHEKFENDNPVIEDENNLLWLFDKENFMGYAHDGVNVTYSIMDLDDLRYF